MSFFLLTVSENTKSFSSNDLAMENFTSQRTLSIFYPRNHEALKVVTLKPMAIQDTLLPFLPKVLHHSQSKEEDQILYALESQCV